MSTSLSTIFPGGDAGFAYENHNNFKYVASRHYSSMIDTASTFSAAALTANTLYLVPFIVITGHTFTGVTFENTSAAETGFKGIAGVYDYLVAGPTNLLATGTEITLGAAAAVNVGTISKYLDPGVYALAIVSDSALTVRHVSTNEWQNGVNSPLGFFFWDIGISPVAKMTLSVAHTYNSALPDPVSGYALANVQPLICLRG